MRISMNRNNYNAIYRLNAILSLFQMEDREHSIQEIAEMLEVPVSVIRDDIIMLHTHKKCGITFYWTDSEEDDETKKTDLADLLRTGEADDRSLSANTYFKEEIQLPLNEMEVIYLNDFLDGKQFSVKNIQRNYTIKPMYNQARANMQVKVKEINEVIQKGKNIRVKYRVKKGGLREWLLRPLELVHNAMDDLYFVNATDGEQIITLRLDRIRSFCETSEKVELKDDENLKSIANIWGMESGDKVHIKIKILNEANVQHKVKRDLAQRVNGIWTQEGENLYFEDDVIGINNFRSWLNSYGSSVLVIEPECLREEIIESAKKRLSFYEGVSELQI